MRDGLDSRRLLLWGLVAYVGWIVFGLTRNDLLLQMSWTWWLPSVSGAALAGVALALWWRGSSPHVVIAWFFGSLVATQVAIGLVRAIHGFAFGGVLTALILDSIGLGLAMERPDLVHWLLAGLAVLAALDAVIAAFDAPPRFIEASLFAASFALMWAGSRHLISDGQAKQSTLAPSSPDTVR